VWICAGGKLTALTNLGMEIIGSPFKGGGLSDACQGLAIDGMGSIWVENSDSVSKFSNLGDTLSPAGGIAIPFSPTDDTAVSLYPPTAIDSSNNVWVAGLVPSHKLSGDLSLAELNNAGGSPYYLSPLTSVGVAPSNFVNLNSSDEPQI